MSTQALAVADRLKAFLVTAAESWTPAEQAARVKQFFLPNGEPISCVYWKSQYYITGTDIIRTLIYRFHAFGRPVTNMKKFEEGVFSDLRNLKAGVDACLEEPRSEFLELLYKHNCIRTQKKQKVFFWHSVPHDKLFMDALERDLKREALGMAPTTSTLRSNTPPQPQKRAPSPIRPAAGVPNMVPYHAQPAPQSQYRPDVLAPASEALSIDEWINKDAFDWDNYPPFQPHQQHQPQPQPYLDQYHSRPTSSTTTTPTGSPDFEWNRSFSISTTASDEMFQSFYEDSPAGLLTSPISVSHPSTNIPKSEHDYPMFNSFDHSRRRLSHPYVRPHHMRRASLPVAVDPEDDDRRTYLCTFPSCPKKFKRMEHMRRHARCHTGERPYVCSVETCDKSFARSDNLANHLRTHYMNMNGTVNVKSPGSGMGMGMGIDADGAGVVTVSGSGSGSGGMMSTSRPIANGMPMNMTYASPESHSHNSTAYDIRGGNGFGLGTSSSSDDFGDGYKLTFIKPEGHYHANSAAGSAEQGFAAMNMGGQGNLAGRHNSEGGSGSGGDGMSMTSFVH